MEERKVQMLLPISVRCNTCTKYINKETKFNSQKENVIREVDNVNNTTKEPRAKWTTFYDRVFADAMVEQMHHGRMTKNGFSKAAWNQIQAKFHVKTGCNYTLYQMRNRLQLLKVQYRTLKGLIELSGFGWDQILHVVTAEADVWEAYVKEHPAAEHFRTQGFPIFDHMAIICGDSAVDGRHVGSQESVSLQHDTLGGTLHPMQEEATHEPLAEDAQSTKDTDTPCTSNKRRLVTPCSSRCQKKDSGQSVTNNVVEAIYELADASRSRTAAMMPIEDRYSLSKCILALGEIEGITDDIFVQGCEVLKDPTNREIFMSMGAHIRLRWLKFQISRSL